MLELKLECEWKNPRVENNRANIFVGRECGVFEERNVSVSGLQRAGGVGGGHNNKFLNFLSCKMGLCLPSDH